MIAGCGFSVPPPVPWEGSSLWLPIRGTPTLPHSLGLGPHFRLRGLAWTAPQIWGGYVCQHFARRGVCQFLPKIQPKAGKRRFVHKIQ